MNARLIQGILLYDGRVTVELPTLCALVGVAFVAGGVDAVGGGGGLLTVPALLLAGLPPHATLGTNKGQSVFGAGAALLRFIRARAIPFGRARWMFPLGFLGSLAGAWAVSHVDPKVLTPVVMVLLAAAAVVLVAVRPRPGTERPRATFFGALLAVGIGAYDGFFGPGTGTFLIAGFTALLGLTLVQASAEAKVVNFASNLAAVALFASQGRVLWAVALPMAAGQALGGWIGAHVAVRGGDRVVRWVVVAVAAALLVKLGAGLL
jgi:hypothetical protein